jgi:hypothetical protein
MVSEHLIFHGDGRQIGFETENVFNSEREASIYNAV